MNDSIKIGSIEIDILWLLQLIRRFLPKRNPKQQALLYRPDGDTPFARDSKSHAKKAKSDKKTTKKGRKNARKQNCPKGTFTALKEFLDDNSDKKTSRKAQTRPKTPIYCEHCSGQTSFKGRPVCQNAKIQCNKGNQKSGKQLPEIRKGRPIHIQTEGKSSRSKATITVHRNDRDAKRYPSRGKDKNTRSVKGEENTTRLCNLFQDNTGETHRKGSLTFQALSVPLVSEKSSMFYEEPRDCNDGNYTSLDKDIENIRKIIERNLKNLNNTTSFMKEMFNLSLENTPVARLPEGYPRPVAKASLISSSIKRFDGSSKTTTPVSNFQENVVTNVPKDKHKDMEFYRLELVTSLRKELKEAKRNSANHKSSGSAKEVDLRKQVIQNQGGKLEAESISEKASNSQRYGRCVKNTEFSTGSTDWQHSSSEFGSLCMDVQHQQLSFTSTSGMTTFFGGIPRACGSSDRTLPGQCMTSVPHRVLRFSAPETFVSSGVSLAEHCDQVYGADANIYMNHCVSTTTTPTNDDRSLFLHNCNQRNYKVTTVEALIPSGNFFQLRQVTLLSEPDNSSNSLLSETEYDCDKETATPIPSAQLKLPIQPLHNPIQPSTYKYSSYQSLSPMRLRKPSPPSGTKPKVRHIRKHLIHHFKSMFQPEFAGSVRRGCPKRIHHNPSEENLHFRNNGTEQGSACNTLFDVTAMNSSLEREIVRKDKENREISYGKPHHHPDMNETTPYPYLKSTYGRERSEQTTEGFRSEGQNERSEELKRTDEVTSQGSKDGKLPQRIKKLKYTPRDTRGKEFKSPLASVKGNYKMSTDKMMKSSGSQSLFESTDGSDFRLKISKSDDEEQSSVQGGGESLELQDHDKFVPKYAVSDDRKAIQLKTESDTEKRKHVGIGLVNFKTARKKSAANTKIPENSSKHEFQGERSSTHSYSSYGAAVSCDGVDEIYDPCEVMREIRPDRRELVETNNDTRACKGGNDPEATSFSETQAILPKTLDTLKEPYHNHQIAVESALNESAIPRDELFEMFFNDELDERSHFRFSKKSDKEKNCKVSSDYTERKEGPCFSASQETDRKTLQTIIGENVDKSGQHCDILFEKYFGRQGMQGFRSDHEFEPLLLNAPHNPNSDQLEGDIEVHSTDGAKHVHPRTFALPPESPVITAFTMQQRKLESRLKPKTENNRSDEVEIDLDEINEMWQEKQRELQKTGKMGARKNLHSKSSQVLTFKKEKAMSRDAEEVSFEVGGEICPPLCSEIPKKKRGSFCKKLAQLKRATVKLQDSDDENICSSKEKEGFNMKDAVTRRSSKESCEEQHFPETQSSEEHLANDQEEKGDCVDRDSETESVDSVSSSSSCHKSSLYKAPHPVYTDQETEDIFSMIAPKKKLRSPLKRLSQRKREEVERERGVGSKSVEEVETILNGNTSPCESPNSSLSEPEDTTEVSSSEDKSRGEEEDIEHFSLRNTSPGLFEKEDLPVYDDNDEESVTAGTLHPPKRKRESLLNRLLKKRKCKEESTDEIKKNSFGYDRNTSCSKTTIENYAHEGVATNERNFGLNLVIGNENDNGVSPQLPKRKKAPFLKRFAKNDKAQGAAMQSDDSEKKDTEIGGSSQQMKASYASFKQQITGCDAGSVDITGIERKLLDEEEVNMEEVGILSTSFSETEKTSLKKENVRQQTTTAHDTKIKNDNSSSESEADSEFGITCTESVEDSSDKNSVTTTHRVIHSNISMLSESSLRTTHRKKERNAHSIYSTEFEVGCREDVCNHDFLQPSSLVTRHNEDVNKSNNYFTNCTERDVHESSSHQASRRNEFQVLVKKEYSFSKDRGSSLDFKTVSKGSKRHNAANQRPPLTDGKPPEKVDVTLSVLDEFSPSWNLFAPSKAVQRRSCRKESVREANEHNLQQDCKHSRYIDTLENSKSLKAQGHDQQNTMNEEEDVKDVTAGVLDEFQPPWSTNRPIRKGKRHRSESSPWHSPLDIRLTCSPDLGDGGVFTKSDIEKLSRRGKRIHVNNASDTNKTTVLSKRNIAESDGRSQIKPTGGDPPEDIEEMTYSPSFHKSISNDSNRHSMFNVQRQSSDIHTTNVSQRDSGRQSLSTTKDEVREEKPLRKSKEEMISLKESKIEEQKQQDADIFASSYSPSFGTNGKGGSTSEVLLNQPEVRSTSDVFDKNSNQRVGKLMNLKKLNEYPKLGSEHLSNTIEKPARRFNRASLKDMCEGTYQKEMSVPQLQSTGLQEKHSRRFQSASLKELCEAGMVNEEHEHERNNLTKAKRTSRRSRGETICADAVEQRAKSKMKYQDVGKDVPSWLVEKPKETKQARDKKDGKRYVPEGPQSGLQQRKQWPSCLSNQEKAATMSNKKGKSDLTAASGSIPKTECKELPSWLQPQLPTVPRTQTFKSEEDSDDIFSKPQETLSKSKNLPSWLSTSHDVTKTSKKEGYVEGNKSEEDDIFKAEVEQNKRLPFWLRKSNNDEQNRVDASVEADKSDDDLFHSTKHEKVSNKHFPNWLADTASQKQGKSKDKYKEKEDNLDDDIFTRMKEDHGYKKTLPSWLQKSLIPSNASDVHTASKEMKTCRGKKSPTQKIPTWLQESPRPRDSKSTSQVSDDNVDIFPTKDTPISKQLPEWLREDPSLKVPPKRVQNKENEIIFNEMERHNRRRNRRVEKTPEAKSSTTEGILPSNFEDWFSSKKDALVKNSQKNGIKTSTNEDKSKISRKSILPDDADDWTFGSKPTSRNLSCSLQTEGSKQRRSSTIHSTQLDFLGYTPSWM